MIEVSNGEVIDRWTILVIKESMIRDEVAISNVKRELESIRDIRNDILSNNIVPLENGLFLVNEKLWDVEDKLRMKEKYGEFDGEFIELARSVYKLNDERARLKREINDITKSNIVEEKSYEKY